MDTIAPKTTIVTGPTGNTPAGPVEMTFTASETGSTFACKIDDGSFEPCSSPLSIAAPAAGPHTVQVRATDPAGSVDQTPAVREWTTLPPPDSSAPETTILSAPTGRIAPGPVDITFESDEAFSTFECKIDTTAYAPCSSPLHIEAPALGDHTVDIRAIDHDGNPDPKPATVSWSTVAPRVDLCGTITSDRTLSPDEATVYVITCNLVIPTSVTLTVDPDTIIKSASNAGLDVAGTLAAKGTSGSPVVFTSDRDDSVGGDTNGDGSASPPDVNDWSGIDVRDGALRLEHARVSYASGVRATLIHSGRLPTAR